MKNQPKPMFRSTPEGEEKLCTRCGDYWPCDAEFFARTRSSEGKTTWSSWCRCCAIEATKASRQRSLERNRSRTSARAAALAVMVLSAARVGASDYCDRLSTLGFEIQQGKEAGVSIDAQRAVQFFTTDDVFREAGLPLIDMIYDGNADNGYNPSQVADLVRSVCEATETNALTRKETP